MGSTSNGDFFDVVPISFTSLVSGFLAEADVTLEAGGGAGAGTALGEAAATLGEVASALGGLD